MPRGPEAQLRGKQGRAVRSACRAHFSELCRRCGPCGRPAGRQGILCGGGQVRRLQRPTLFSAVASCQQAHQKVPCKDTPRFAICCVTQWSSMSRLLSDDQLVSACGADDFPANICSGGGPYALATAHYLPDRVRGVLLISPASDYGELAFPVSLARKPGVIGMKVALFGSACVIVADRVRDVSSRTPELCLLRLMQIELDMQAC